MTGFAKPEQRWPKTAARFQIVDDDGTSIALNADLDQWIDQLDQRAAFEDLSSGKAKLRDGWYAWDVEYFIDVFEP